jgi:hypothetical protein
MENEFIKFYSDFQEYMYSNNIIITASGFTIGYFTYYFINDLFNQIIVPIFMSFILIFYRILQEYISMPKNKYFVYFIDKFIHFCQICLKWIFGVFFGFIILEYLFNRKIVGLTSTIEKEKKKEFIDSKIELKKQNISSTEDIVKEIKETEHKINKKVEAEMFSSTSLMYEEL